MEQRGSRGRRPQIKSFKLDECNHIQASLDRDRTLPQWIGPLFGQSPRFSSCPTATEYRQFKKAHVFGAIRKLPPRQVPHCMPLI